MGNTALITLTVEETSDKGYCSILLNLLSLAWYYLRSRLGFGQARLKRKSEDMSKPEFLIGEVASMFPDLYHPDSDLAAVMREREGVENMPRFPGEWLFASFEETLEQAVDYFATRMFEIGLSDAEVKRCLRSGSEILRIAALRSSATSAGMLNEFVTEEAGGVLNLGFEVSDILRNPNTDEEMLLGIALVCVREEFEQELERAHHHSNWNSVHNAAVQSSIDESGLSWQFGT
jgi:hypothetical protein